MAVRRREYCARACLRKRDRDCGFSSVRSFLSLHTFELTRPYLSESKCLSIFSLLPAIGSYLDYPKQLGQIKKKGFLEGAAQKSVHDDEMPASFSHRSTALIDFRMQRYNSSRTWSFRRQRTVVSPREPKTTRRRWRRRTGRAAVSPSLTSAPTETSLTPSPPTWPPPSRSPWPWPATGSAAPPRGTVWPRSAGSGRGSGKHGVLQLFLCRVENRYQPMSPLLAQTTEMRKKSGPRLRDSPTAERGSEKTGSMQPRARYFAYPFRFKLNLRCP